MSCLFCDSYFHLTDSCNIYVTNKFRKKILRFKNRCEYCLSQLQESREESFLKRNFDNTETECSKRCCHFCFNSIDKKHEGFWSSTKDRQKCYKCFSPKHHTVFCTEENTDPYLCLPNIDADLHQRFIKLCNLSEQYILAFSFTISWKLFKQLKLLQIKNNLENGQRFKENPNFTICMTGTFYIFKQLLNPELKLNQIVCKAKMIMLFTLTISSQDLLLLISSFTEILELSNVEIVEGITFVEILQKAPNAKKIMIVDTVVKVIADTWLDQLLLNNNNKKLEKLLIVIDYANLNMKKLIDLMKQKRIFIVLSVSSCENLMTEILQNFIAVNSIPNDQSVVCFQIPFSYCLKAYETIGHFCLKTIENF